MGYSFTYALTTRLFLLGLDSKSLEVRTVIPNDLRVHAEKVSISVYGDLTYLSLNHKTGKNTCYNSQPFHTLVLSKVAQIFEL